MIPHKLLTIGLCAALVALTASCCRRPVPTPGGPTTARTGVDPLARALAASRVRRTARILMKMVFRQQGKRRTTRAIALLRRPAGLRLELLTMFQQPAAVLAVQGDRIAGVDVLRKTWSSGRASTATMRRLSGLPFHPRSLVALLFGEPPLERGDQPRLERLSQGLAVYVVKKSKGVLRITVSAKARRVVEVRYYEAAKLVFSVKYARFRRCGKTRCARSLRVWMPARRVRLRIEFKRARYGLPIAKRAFKLPRPRGFRVISLDGTSR